MAAPWKQSTEKKSDYKQPPAGNHPAVMVAMVDLGTQTSEFKNKVRKQRRVMCVWELVAEKDENFPLGDDNYLVGIDLDTNLGYDKSRLRLWIEARKNKKMPEKNPDGTPFYYDIAQELGQSCLLSVQHNEKGYCKVDGMSAVPKGMTVPPAKRKPFLWSLDELPKDGTEPQLPEWLPRLYGKKLADVIAECEELNDPQDDDNDSDTDTQDYGDPVAKSDDVIPF